MHKAARDSGCHPSTLLVGRAAATTLVVVIVPAGSGQSGSLPCGTPLLPAPQFALQGTPLAIVVADFNGDGHTDLAATTSAGIEVLLGSGSGDFHDAVTHDAGTFALALAVADLNLDGHQDLVALTPHYDRPDSATVLLGNGDGTFGRSVSYETGPDSWSLAAADLNGDNHADLAVTSSAGVSILIGNGDGSFQALVNYVAGSAPRAIATGDLDGDGDRDIAVTSSTPDISILLNQGIGTFALPIGVESGSHPLSVAIADLDGDRIPDLASASREGDNVSIMAGNGDGTFGPPMAHSTRDAEFVDAGDLDHDGDIDLAVVIEDCIAAAHDYCIAVLINQGDGSFAPAVNYVAGLEPRSLVIEDINGDGNPDLAVAGDDHVITTLSGRGDGTFLAVVRREWDAGLPQAARDLNGDDVADLVLVDSIPYQVAIALGAGDGSFGEPVIYPMGANPGRVDVGDVDGDGDIDIAVGRESSNGVSVLLNAGDGSFAAPVSYDTGGAGRAVAIADLDGDGVADLAVTRWAQDSVVVLPGLGGGDFGPPVAAVDTENGPVTIAARDLDADGNVDLAVGCYFAGMVSVLLNAGDGSFAPAVNYSSGSGGSPGDIAVDDLDGDGDDDIAVANYYFSPSVSHLAILFNLGDGSFAAPVSYVSPFTVGGVEIADINGDGLPDLITAAINHNAAYYQGVGDGTFLPPRLYALGQIRTVADFDGDGDQDLAGGFLYDNLSVAFNNSCRLGDLDRDGIVGPADLELLLDAWSPCPAPCPPFCPGDLDQSCSVSTTDLLILLGNWG